MIIQRFQRIVVYEIIPLPMRNRYFIGTVDVHLCCNQRLGSLRCQVNIFTNKLTLPVMQQCSGYQTCLSEYLESIAYTQKVSAFIGVSNDFLHDGRKARNRTGTQIIAIGKPPGEHNKFSTLQVMVFMP